MVGSISVFLTGLLIAVLVICAVIFLARPSGARAEASTEQMPVPFGTASASAPYFAMPCNERLSSLPECLMKMAKGSYSWEYEYRTGKPAYALTLMDYANIYSFIHTHDLNPEKVREALSDASQMVHRKAFTDEEIGLLLGDDQEKAMAHFASPGTIVIGKKGYCAKCCLLYTSDAADE